MHDIYSYMCTTYIGTILLSVTHVANLLLHKETIVLLGYIDLVMPLQIPPITYSYLAMLVMLVYLCFLCIDLELVKVAVF